MSHSRFSLLSRGLVLLLAVVASPVPAQQVATEVQQETHGACSPGIINNSGFITIYCGPNNVELLKTLNELLTSNTQQQLLPVLQKMRREMEQLSQLAPRREAFGEALAHGNSKAVKQLLAQGVTPYEEYHDKYAMEGFFANARNLSNRADIFKLLLDHGLDVDRELDQRLSPQKRTVFEYVLETGSVDLFQLLWKASHNPQAIHDLLEAQFIIAQEAQRRAHAGTPRGNPNSEEALLDMWRIAEPHQPFLLSLREVKFETGITGKASPGTAYDGPDGCFIFLKTTSLLRSVSYELGGQHRKAEWTTRLPILREELLSPVTPVTIEATDAIGRHLGPFRISIDIEDVRC